MIFLVASSINKYLGLAISASPKYIKFFLFPVTPEFGHILKCLTLGLGNEFPYEDGCDNTDDALETVGEPVTEVITLCEMHIEHRDEG